MHRFAANLTSANGGICAKLKREPVLRDQLNRRKGGGGKPDRSKDSSAPASHSSEKERAEPSERTAHQAQQTGPGSDRPGRGAESGPEIPSAGCGIQGLRRCVVQELRFVTDNVSFARRSIYAASTAEPPGAAAPGYHGEFGPNLKSLCLLFSHLCNMTEQIADLFDNLASDLQRQIIAWLTGAYRNSRRKSGLLWKPD